MEARAVVLFDGVCNLCNGTVRWILERDARERFVFASLQSDAAADVLERAGFRGERPDSLVLVDADGAHFHSDAALRIAAGLGLPWSVLGWARIVPRFVRDGIYRWVARNRYRWFGRSETCALPRPGQERRFLDADGRTDRADRER